MRAKREPEILTPAECAALLRVCSGTIYDLVRARKIPFFTVANSYRFKRAELLAWMRAIEVNSSRPG